MFPDLFWMGTASLERAKVITDFLIKDKLNWSDTDMKNQLTSLTIFLDYLLCLLLPTLE